MRKQVLLRRAPGGSLHFNSLVTTYRDSHKEIRERGDTRGGDTTREEDNGGRTILPSTSKSKHAEETPSAHERLGFVTVFCHS
jgi:hypothetical protein